MLIELWMTFFSADFDRLVANTWGKDALLDHRKISDKSGLGLENDRMDV